MTLSQETNIMFNHVGYLCPYASGKQLSCPYKGDRCPLQDTDFLEKLETYLFLPRLSTYVLEPLQKIKSVQEFRKIAHLSEIFRLLPQSTQRLYRVLRFFYTFFRTDEPGQLHMSNRLCREIREIRAKFNRRLRDRE